MARSSSPRPIDTVVIGAGQAGLMMSYHLGRAGREHLLLERRPTVGGAWQDRWDRFRLVSPNWTSAFPGLPYEGDDPDAFMLRDDIVGRVRGYASTISAPIMLNTEVTRLSYDDHRGRFIVETNQGPMSAREVVVASGAYRRPRIPQMAANLPTNITQLHSLDYRSEEQLPPGAVLVVGSGQTGVQLTDELVESGRRVYLAVGSAGRTRRRYRGRDIFWWLVQVKVDGARYGIPFPSVATLPDPGMRLAALPQLTGHKGGRHEVDLRRMSKEDGVGLLGHLQAIDGRKIELADDLTANLQRADGFFDARFRPPIDQYISLSGIDAPEDEPPIATDYVPVSPVELDLTDAGITSVIWASGFTPSLGWIDLPILDQWGLPRLTANQAEIPGLYFLGMPWQSTMFSANMPGTVWDAADVAASMGIAQPETGGVVMA